MIYLENFQPNQDARHVYPYSVISPKQLEHIEFSPITIFYGNNGSGKSTLLNIIADRIGISNKTFGNSNEYFQSYVQKCTYSKNGYLPEDSTFFRSEDLMEKIVCGRKKYNRVTIEAQNMFEKLLPADNEFSKAHQIRFQRALSDPDALSGDDRFLLSNTADVSKSMKVRRELAEFRSNGETALKFLAQNNQIDVITSGSLLGLSYKDIESIPVGYERQIEMHALDFEEFLWALGMNENAINLLKTNFEKLEKIDSSINDIMLEKLRTFLVVGGMPAVVNKFIETNNFNEVQIEQEKLLASYYDDISKFASLPERPKVKNCLLSIPKQLAKENKKFQFSQVEKGGTTRKFGNTIEWLCGARLVNCCVNLSLPEFPLAAYEDSSYYKIYMNDTGLLCAMYGFETKKLILENKLTGHAKGGIYENLIADFLIKKGYKLRYFKPKENAQEIEFFIEKDGKIIPIEVKAGNGSTISMNQILALKNIDFGYKFISGNIGTDGKKITLPLYMAMFL